MLVRDVAASLSAQFVGDGSLSIDRIVHPAFAAKSSDLAVAMTPESFAALKTSNAEMAVIAAKSTPQPDRLKAVIITDHGRKALAALTAMFDPGPSYVPGIHATAIVSPDAVIGEGASIGPFVVVGPGSQIGARTIVLASVTIGARVSIGEQGLIYSGVRIGDRVTIGDRAIIHYNAAIGSDGFSFLATARSVLSMRSIPTRIHSLGDVLIEDDVEIGAGTTIDRATLGTTRIGSGTKIDNQVQIAHNVTIGNDCRICGMVGISGSAVIGDRAVLGGGVGVADHIHIGSDAVVAASSSVARDVPAGTVVSGSPAMPHARTMEALLYAGRQKMLHRKVEELKAAIEELERSTRNDAGRS